MKIKEWSIDERPRERVISQGVDSVSSAELLAILIGSGTANESSVDLIRRILSENGNSLRALSTLSREELEKYNGIGPAKAVTIQAAMELGKRLMRETHSGREAVMSAKDMYDYFRTHILDLPHEECHMLMLDVKNRIMGHKLISRGGITESSVDIRLVLRSALITGATSIVLCHNHPSGVPTPSKADDLLTRKLQDACEVMQIRLLDHVILGSDSYYSYYESGKL